MGLLDRLRRRRAAPPLEYADDGSLTVLLVADDAARSDTAVLAEASERGVDLTPPLLVRHHLVALPDAAAVERARVLLGQDGYTLTVGEGPPYAVRAWRTQVLTPLAAAQERSRMAGLAQRLGGDVAGYDVLGPPGEQQPGEQQPGEQQPAEERGPRG
ncbi:MAG: ribonuclease E inhibitor RraB [Actinomycetota bacterium]|nr:ribonuclease E inhibitor RraB [Actinomycetota bacterium]